MPPRKELPRAVQALLTGVAVGGLVLLLHVADAFPQLELKTRDLRMRWTLPRKGSEDFNHPEIGLVDISDRSLSWFTDMDPKHRSWPWPRDVISTIFRGCAMGKARVILFDMFTHL